MTMCSYEIIKAPPPYCHHCRRAHEVIPFGRSEVYRCNGCNEYGGPLRIRIQAQAPQEEAPEPEENSQDQEEVRPIVGGEFESHLIDVLERSKPIPRKHRRKKARK